MKIIKILLAVAVLLGIIKLALSMYFNFIYYPANPAVYSDYELKLGYSPGFDPDPNSNELIMTPPLGGCVGSCQGKQEKVSCVQYSKAYDMCTYKCYGYLYSNCHGSLGLIKLLLVR